MRTWRYVYLQGRRQNAFQALHYNIQPKMRSATGAIHDKNDATGMQTCVWTLFSRETEDQKSRAAGPVMSRRPDGGVELHHAPEPLHCFAHVRDRAEHDLSVEVVRKRPDELALDGSGVREHAQVMRELFVVRDNDACRKTIIIDSVQDNGRGLAAQNSADSLAGAATKTWAERAFTPSPEVSN